MTRKYIQNCTGPDCSNQIDQDRQPTKISRRLSRVIFYVLASFFVAVLGYMLFFATYLQITDIKISGTQELSSQDMQEKFQASLDGKYLKFVPKNNFLFISQNNVKKFLEDNFKKIRSVSVTKKFPNTVLINIDEHKALMVWCSGQDCFLIDENGAAYGNADFNSAELLQNHLVKVRDNSALEIKIGSVVMDAQYEAYVLGIRDSLAKEGFELEDEYWTPSRLSQEINVRTTSGIEIYFSTEFPLDSAMRTLGVVLKKEIPEDKRDNIQYIDLRSEYKVFYKFKDSENKEQEGGDSEKDSPK